MTDHPNNVIPIIERLSDEADLCRNDGANDIAVLLDESRAIFSEIVDDLKEIARGEGEFNREPLVHAENTIENMKQIATAALAKIGGAA